MPETNKNNNGSQVKLSGEIEKFCIWHPDILEMLERSTLLSRPTASEKVSIFSPSYLFFLGGGFGLLGCNLPFNICLNSKKVKNESILN